MSANPTISGGPSTVRVPAGRGDLHAVANPDPTPTTAMPGGAGGRDLRPSPSSRDAVQRAYAEARHLGLFIGPTWTVLLATDPGTGAVLVPFVVRARRPELAKVAAAAVIRMEGLQVLGVIPGEHLPLPGSRALPAAHLSAAAPMAFAAAAAVLEGHLSELQEGCDAAQTEPTGPVDSRVRHPGPKRQGPPSGTRAGASAGIRLGGG